MRGHVLQLAALHFEKRPGLCEFALELLELLPATGQALGESETTSYSELAFELPKRQGGA